MAMEEIKPWLPFTTLVIAGNHSHQHAEEQTDHGP
jgi:hypothetical protein